MSIGETRGALQAGIQELETAPVAGAVSSWEAVPVDHLLELLHSLRAIIATLRHDTVPGACTQGLQTQGAGESAYGSFSEAVQGSGDSRATVLLTSTQEMIACAGIQESAGSALINDLDIALKGLGHVTDALHGVERHQAVALDAATRTRDAHSQAMRVASDYRDSL